MVEQGLGGAPCFVFAAAAKEQWLNEAQLGFICTFYVSLVSKMRCKLQLVFYCCLLSSLELSERSRLDEKQNETSLIAIAGQPARNSCATGDRVNKIILSNSIAVQVSKQEDKRDVSEPFSCEKV